MPFGRSAPEISEELAQKRLRGLLERAALKEKADSPSPETPGEPKPPRAAKASRVETSDSDSEGACDTGGSFQKPRLNASVSNGSSRSATRANRNSLLPGVTQNRWKRTEAIELTVPSLKRSKPESTEESSSEDEQSLKRKRVKKEKKEASVENCATIVSSSRSPTPASSSEEETAPSRWPNQDEYISHEVALQGDGKLELGPDEEFFKPLGAVAKIKKKTELVAGLPLWVKQAIPVSAKVEASGDLEEDVDVLGKSLVRLLREAGIVGLFPMQKLVIRELLDPRYVVMDLPPRDICVAAPTGSGKTLAYVLPLIKLLKGLSEKAIRAVILLPTSELAKQVHDVFSHYAEPFQLSAALLTGLKSHSEEVKTLLERGHPIVDVVIATPKSFLKHLRLTPGFSLRLVSHLVLDEADRMVDMVIHGLIREVEDAIYTGDSSRCRCSEIVYFERSRPTAISCCTMDAHCLPLRKLLYSATLMSDPEKLRHVNLFYPRVFHAKAEHTSETTKAFALPASLKELKIFCEIGIRPLLVWWLSTRMKMNRMIVFARSRDECHRLRVVIEYMGDCKAVDISADLKKRQRQSALADFDNGLYDVLVCTSVLARGMDLKNVEHVVLYHVPASAEDYVHMVGRTARANKQGKSIVLLNPAENTKLTRTLKTIANSKPKELHWKREDLEDFYQRYEAALASAKKAILSQPRS